MEYQHYVYNPFKITGITTFAMMPEAVLLAKLLKHMEYLNSLRTPSKTNGIPIFLCPGQWILDPGSSVLGPESGVLSPWP